MPCPNAESEPDRGAITPMTATWSPSSALVCPVPQPDMPTVKAVTVNGAANMTRRLRTGPPAREEAANRTATPARRLPGRACTYVAFGMCGT